MTILYKQDWDYYPDAIIDTQTKNKGFLRLAALYKGMGVENHAFILALHDKTLQGVNPYDPNLSEEIKIRILTEIRSNYWYFLREIARVPTHDTVNIIPFKPNRGIIAAYWTYFNHVQQVIVFPRQTGKSFGIDWLNVWISLFAATDYITNVLTKDDKLRARHMSRLKSMMECIPAWLQFKKKSDPSNSEQILISRLSNQVNAFVPNPSPKLAYNVARGSSAATFIIDEFGYILHIEIILASAMPATTAARELAAMKGEPYGNIFMTTAPKKDDRDGAVADNYMNNSCRMHEQFYDCIDINHLYTLIKSNSPNQEIRMLQRYSHRQLGYTDEWLAETMRETGVRGEDADRDYFNISTSGSQTSPFTAEELKTMKDSVVNDYHMDFGNKENLITRWFYRKENFHQAMLADDHILSLDTSDAAGGDDIAMTIRKSATGEIVATGRYNELNLIHFSRWLANWFILYPRLFAIIERRSTGAMIIDYLLFEFYAHGINPFKRLYNLVFQCPENYDKETVEQLRRDKYVDPQRLSGRYKSAFGFATAANGIASRSDLYGNNLRSAIKHTGGSIRDEDIVNQLVGLVKRNNRIDHPLGAKDDFCISWLLSYWWLTQGRNLDWYGIDSRSVLKNVSSFQSEHGVVSNYRTAFSEHIKAQIEYFLTELSKSKDMHLNHRYELQIKALINKLPAEEVNIISFDELIRNAKTTKSQRHQLKR